MMIMLKYAFFHPKSEESIRQPSIQRLFCYYKSNKFLAHSKLRSHSQKNTAFIRTALAISQYLCKK